MLLKVPYSHAERENKYYHILKLMHLVFEKDKLRFPHSVKQSARYYRLGSLADRLLITLSWGKKWEGIEGYIFN